MRQDTDDWEVSFGREDPPEPVEVRVHEVAGQRHAVVVPRTVQKLSGEASEVVYELQRAALQMQQLRDRIADLVDEARELDVPWTAIGWSIGTTAQAAQQRYTPHDDD